MIQRIQSIFLLISSGSFFGQFAVPFASSSNAGPNYFSDLMYNIHDNIGMLIMAIVGGVIALGAIFLFKNRQLQLRMSYLVIVLSILLPALAILLFFRSGNTMDSVVGIEDGIGLYLPIVGVVFGALSSRFIQKDQKLVKSMDRLR